MKTRKKPVPKFKFISELSNLSHLIQLTEEQCQQLGVPPFSAQYLPIQSKLEEFIFSKYVQYNRQASAFDIFQSVCSQLKDAAARTQSIHPDFTLVLAAIYADCFPHEMPNRIGASKPKRKYCSGCSKVLSTDQFEGIRSNKDKFARLCIRCNARRNEIKKIRKENAKSQPLLPPEPRLSADELDDNPDHDIFDELE